MLWVKRSYKCLQNGIRVSQDAHVHFILLQTSSNEFQYEQFLMHTLCILITRT